MYKSPLFINRSRTTYETHLLRRNHIETVGNMTGRPDEYEYGTSLKSHNTFGNLPRRHTKDGTTIDTLDRNDFGTIGLHRGEKPYRIRIGKTSSALGKQIQYSQSGVYA